MSFKRQQAPQESPYLAAIPLKLLDLYLEWFVTRGEGLSKQADDTVKDVLGERLGNTGALRTIDRMSRARRHGHRSGGGGVTVTARYSEQSTSSP